MTTPEKPVTLEEKIAQEWAFSNALDHAGGGGEATADPEPPPNTFLDRYGFVVPVTPDMKGPAPLPKTEVEIEQRRLEKWRKMIGTGGSDWKQYYQKRAGKVKERVRKGIPNELRGIAWQLLTGSRDLMLRNQGVYDRLLMDGKSPSEVEIIRDISRTFPNHIHYHQRHGLGQRQLYNVLKAYSVYDVQVGYVQGMGFIAGILLLYMCEEDTFWLMVALLKGIAHEPLEGLFQHGLPLVQLSLYQFERVVKEMLPALGAHLDAEMVHPTMYASQWFITLFSYSLPFDIVLRIWDVFMLEGMKVIFRVGIALLAQQQDTLIKLPFERLVSALKKNPDPGKASADQLLRVALDFKMSKRLEDLKAQYIAEQEKRNSGGKKK